MRIVNRTSFDTRSLRSVLCAALRADEKEDGRLPGWQRDGLRIVVVHARRRNRVSGYATYNGTRMRLRLPDDPSLESVVWLFLHELSHIRGERHRNMSDAVLHRMAADVVAANPNLALRHKPAPEPKAKPPLRLVRYDHAKAMLEAKEKQVARLKRQADKWRRKVRYYERTTDKAAGATVEPPEERRSDPICGEDTCAACEQTTCRPDDDCDEAFTASAAALLKASQTDCDDRDGCPCCGLNDGTHRDGCSMPTWRPVVSQHEIMMRAELERMAMSAVEGEREEDERERLRAQAVRLGPQATESSDFADEASRSAVEDMAWSILEDDRDERKEGRR